MGQEIIEVAAGVIIEHGKVLIVRRSPDQRLAGYWEFAGGKREPEESIEACLIRELKEELAVHIEPRKIIFTHEHRTDDGVIRLISLGAKIVEGDPTLTVHDQLAWVRPIDLLSYKLAPADIPTAQHLVSGEIMNTLKIGDVINNERLMEIFACSPQGGMRRSLKTNTLVVICNHLKSIYSDKWINGVMYYTGMGQEGDQSVDYAQNKTLANSNKNGVEVHLFEVFKDKEYTYSGRVRLGNQPDYAIQQDVNGNDRRVVVFPLVPFDSDEAPIVELKKLKDLEEVKSNKAKRLSDEVVAERAENNYKSVSRTVTSNYYERNIWVTEHAKRRAQGICQLCEQPAPFYSKKGEPYLETHHVEWLSRGGLDAPENTVALCPNCHRKMHIVDDESDKELLRNKAKS